jgi:hypothetical protein
MVKPPALGLITRSQRMDLPGAIRTRGKILPIRAANSLIRGFSWGIKKLGMKFPSRSRKSAAGPRENAGRAAGRLPGPRILNPAYHA